MDTTTTPTPATTAAPRSLIFIFAVIFLDMMGGSLLLPILPYITGQFRSDALTIGLLTMIYAAAAFLSAPALGFLSDRYGRRPVLLLSVLGSALGYVLFGFGSLPGGALWILFVSRAIDGVTGGTATAMAYIADVTQPNQRARMYAFVGVAFGLGFVFGPLLSAGLSGYSLAAPAFAAGALSLASCLFGFFFVPESLPAARRSQAVLRLREVNPFRVLADMGRLPNLGALLAAMFVLYLAYSGMFAYIAAFTLQRFGVSAQQNSMLFLIVGLFQMVGQGLFVYRLTPRFGEKRVALAGLLLQALVYPLFVILPSFGWLYPLAVLSALGNAFTRPTLEALVANSVEPSQQGRAAGSAAAVYSLTSVMGPLLAGLAYDSIGGLWVFLAGGALIGLAFLLLAGGVRGYTTERGVSRA